MKIRVITIDFWNTIYYHQGAKIYRKQIRDKYLIEKCIELGVDNPKSLGISFFDTLDKFIKLSWEKGFSPRNNHILENLANQYQGRYSDDIYFHLIDTVNNLYKNILKPLLYPNAHAVLSLLSEKLPVYLISDTYTIKGKIIDSILTKDNLFSLFSGSFYSDELGFQKPNPASIKLIAKKEKIQANEVLHIGDLVDRDYKLCQNAGSNFILINHQNISQSNYPSNKTFNSTNSCNNFKELLNLIRRTVDCIE